MIRGTFVQQLREKWYGIVRHEAVAIDGRAGLCVKPVADSLGCPVDMPQLFCFEDDFAPASEAAVPWFKLKTLRHVNGNLLLYWERPSEEPICECDSVWFEGSRAVSMSICQI
jgi:hypothetical protein